MDRSDFYYRQIVTEGEMDQAFDDCDAAFKNMVVDLSESASMADYGVCGVFSGLEVVEQATPDLTVHINAGVAYNELGYRAPTEADDVDLAAYVPTTPGESIYLRFLVIAWPLASDPRTDGHGTPLDYRLADRGLIGLDVGTPSGSPTKPARAANRVYLATVLLTYGMTEVTDADIDMNLEGYLSATDRDRDWGGPIPRGRELTVRERLIYNQNEGVVMLVGSGNIIDNSNAYVDKGMVSRAFCCASDKPEKGVMKGHVYQDVAATNRVSTLELLDHERWFSYDYSAMLPGDNNLAHPWQAIGAVGVNSWVIDPTVTAGIISGGSAPPSEFVFNCIGWRVNVSGSTPFPRYTWPLMCPLTGLPNGSNIVRIEVDVYALVAMDSSKRLCFMLMRRRGSLYDVISPNPPTNHNVNSTGNSSWAEDIDSGTGFIVNNEDDAYFVAIYLGTTDVTTYDDLVVCQVRAKVLINEASGMWLKPSP